MSIELKKANEYEKTEQEKIPVEEKPAFHVAAPVGWINDPNGFSWYQGQIHLFYQYHPYTTCLLYTSRHTASRRSQY